jgi:diguanylate cyclase (GGDEF)-like protein
MQDRRQESRHSVLKVGKIIFNNKQSVFDCLIRDLSDSGACLQVNNSLDIPPEFELHIHGEASVRPTRLVWITDTRAGVAVMKDVGGSTTSSHRLCQPPTPNELLTLTAALDLVPIGIVLLDADTRAQFINRAYRRMWKLPDEKAESRPPFIALLYHGRDTMAYAVPSDDLGRYVAQRIAHVKAGNPKPLDLRLASGEVIRMHCTALPTGGRMLCYTYVSDLVRGAEEMAMLRGSLDQMQQGIILLDEFLNAKFMNRAVRQLWDIPDNDADRSARYVDLVKNSGRRGVHAIPADEIDQYVENRVAVVRAGDPTPMDIPHCDGRIIRSQCTVLPRGGRMLTYNDVTDLVNRAKQFEQLATIDGLTGLYNRRHFEVVGEAEWKRYRRYARPLSLILVDIDQFKAINDQHGHEAGDAALKRLATLLMEAKRSTDIIARLGGDEFVMLLPETNLQEARAVADRLVSDTKRMLGITLSIGIAEAARTMSGIEALLRPADRALYRAKSAGRNCIRSNGAFELIDSSMVSALHRTRLV